MQSVIALHDSAVGSRHASVQGYGKFLISLAYHLSHLEGKPGTAERPLSDLGAVSFRSYWTRQVLDALRDCKGEVTVQVS